MNIDTLNSFIENRIQDNYSILLDNLKYISLNDVYTNKYQSFVSKISDDDKTLFNELIDIKSSLFTEEIYLSYIVGLHDGFEFNKGIK